MQWLKMILGLKRWMGIWMPYCYYIYCKQKEEKVNHNEFLRKIKIWWKKKLFKMGMYFNWNIKEITVYQNIIDGKIELPFQKEILKDINDRVIEKYLKQLKKKIAIKKKAEESGIHFLFQERELKYRFSEVKDYKWFFKILLFDQMLERIVQENHIVMGKVKIGILDSGNDITEYLIEQLISKCNFLTIFTERIEYFEELKEKIYYEEGLWIDLEEKKRQYLDKMDMIVDLCQEGYRCYKYLKEDSCIINMSTNEKNIEGIFAKKGKRKLVYEIDINIGEENEYLDAVMQGIYFKNWKVEYMMQNFMKDVRNIDIQEICNQYRIVLKEVKYA